mmetsp:Transcript_37187/g.80873  ORF Transcript_37187/g.80873 Transcript_37187/m.80873 type:complete len:87 (+) Transcript_37187:633-893(+)
MKNFEYGFMVVPDKDSLVITWIDEGGQLGYWNRSCPRHLIVQQGDRIIAVNHIADPDGMRTQLLSAEECCMHIAQCHDGSGSAQIS